MRQMIDTNYNPINTCAEFSNDKCHCFFFHPATEEGRRQIKENLEYFKKVGDEDGVKIMEHQLEPCKYQMEKD